MLTLLIVCGAITALYILCLGTVGPQFSADGGSPNVRQDKQGSAVVTLARGKYHEAVLRGNVYSATTAVGGVAPGTALGTTAAFCLYNPANSNKLLSLNKAGMGLISGTLGAGVTLLTGFAAGDAVPTGTAIVPKPLAVGIASGSIALPFTTATVTTTAAKMIKILWSMNETVVATTSLNSEVINQDIDGEVVIFPGYGVCIHSVAASGSTPLVIYCVSWEEIGII